MLGAMEVSRAVTIVSKIGVGLVVVFIAVTVFRNTSPLAFLAERSAMRQCVANVEADLEGMIPGQQPTVTSCQGPVTNAVCVVETTVGGVRKTGPVRDWDCTRQHMPEGFGAEFSKTLLVSPEGDLSGVGAKFTQEFLDGVQYVARRVADRQSALRN
jgi:hypothetical protein